MVKLDLNTVFFSGTILKHGVRESKFPSVWMLVKLAPITLTSLKLNASDISFFITVKLDPNENSKKGIVSKKFLDNLKKCNNFFLKNATLGDVKRGVKKGDNWEEVYETGIITSASNIVLSNEPIVGYNLCTLEGIASTIEKNKLILTQSYTVPEPSSDKVLYKQRSIPVLIDSDLDYSQYESKKVFLSGNVIAISSQGSNDKKVFMLSKTIIFYD